MTAGLLIREARRSAGLTQRELARRLGTTQPAIAKLESPRSNPRIATVREALAAVGEELTLASQPAPPSVDESLIRRHLALSPSERLAGLETMYSEARTISHAGARSRGNLG